MNDIPLVKIYWAKDKAGGREQAHFVFGVEQGLLMELTGSVAPAIALHNLNLFYDGIKTYVGQYEFLRIAIPLTIILLWAGMIMLYTRLNRKK